MRDTTEIEALEIGCAEESRRARLMLEWKVVDGRRELVGIQCDNPRLAALAPHDCEWSCWEKVAATRR